MVNRDGQIMSIITSGKGSSKKPHILSQIKVGAGYLYSTLVGEDGKHFNMLIHRAVAMCFVDGYAEGAEVNHKNGDKTDNRAENLEWISHRDNIHHARDVLRTVNGNCHCRRVLNKTTGEEYRSIRDAAKSIGVSFTEMGRGVHDGKILKGCSFTFADI